MGKSSFRFEWINVVRGSDLPGISRSVLIVGLSLHMTADGEHCSPSIDTIARETGWSVRTVQHHLHALDEQFVAIDEGGGRWFKDKGRPHAYYPLIPEDVPKAVRTVKAKLKWPR